MKRASRDQPAYAMMKAKIRGWGNAMVGLVRFNRRGDTIVEVMVALAILGAVLGGAYVLASRNLNATQRAQERGEAVKVAEGQLEKLKSIAASTPTVSSTSANSFCILDDASVPSGLSLHRLSASPDPTTLTIDNDPLTGYESCLTGTDSRYHFAIFYDSSTTPGTFKLFVRWLRLGGGKDEVQLSYRLL